MALIIVDKKDAPVKHVVKRGGDVDLYQFPLMRHYEMGGGPYRESFVSLLIRKETEPIPSAPL